MKKTIAIIMVLVLSSTNIGCLHHNNTSANKNNVNKVHNDIDDLWKVVIPPYLSYNLWEQDEAYDAGHFLMVPLHAAFKLNKKEWRLCFDEHFNRFITNGMGDISTDESRLNYLHYYFLLSRYVVLSKTTGDADNENLDSIADFLNIEIKKLWNESPAWQWESQPFKGGMRERIIWKLENRIVERSYYRAIIDEELFVMCIAADLKSYYAVGNKHYDWLDDISHVAYEAFKGESCFDDQGRWLFQVGVWTDHPDYLHAGYLNTNEVRDEPKPMENIATDSSHFHRFPLWITVLRDSYKPDSQEYNLYNNILVGMEIQLFDEVLAYNRENNGYLLTNYMDGNNGLYRWDYSTCKGDGYEPYELSGTFLLGWWTFMDSKRIKEVYAQIAESYPLSEDLVAIYTGPNTSRKRNIYTTSPNSYNNGFVELICELSAKI